MNAAIYMLGLLLSYVAAIAFVTYVLFMGSLDSWPPVRFTYYVIKIKLPQCATRLCRPILPGRCGAFADYLLNTRNRFFTGLYLVLHALAVAHFFLQVLPHAVVVRTSPVNIRIGLVLAGCSFASWVAAVFSHPGRITPDNVVAFTHMYKHTKARKTCSTCELVRPARSKHCGLCDVCHFRSDHHCVWLNNCVAGGNLPLFHLFLVSLIAEALWASFLYLGILADTANVARLWSMRYRDPFSWQVKDADTIAVTQHLFVQLPGIVITGTVYFLLGFGLALFLLFHTYLVLANYTTAEFFRSTPAPALDHDSSDSSPAIKRRLVKRSRGCRISSSPYNFGILLNILDAMAPFLCLKARRQLKVA